SNPVKGMPAAPADANATSSNEAVMGRLRPKVALNFKRRGAARMRQSQPAASSKPAAAHSAGKAAPSQSTASGSAQSGSIQAGSTQTRRNPSEAATEALIASNDAAKPTSATVSASVPVSVHPQHEERPVR